MTEQQPPIFMDGTTSPAEDARRFIGAVMGPGIARAGDLAVTQNGTPNMSVNVAAGGLFVAGTSTAFQGVYFVENRASVNRAIAAADGTNPRIDLVAARVRENVYDSAGDDDWLISVVTGTPGAAPVAPATPANSYVLATVNVPAATSSIVTANITSHRSLARPWNSAWGVPPGGSISPTSVNQAPGAGADIAGIAVTITAVAGRRYRAFYRTSNYDTGGAGTMLHQIRTGSTVLSAATVRSLIALSPAGTLLASGPLTPSAGSYTVKAYGELLAFTTNGFVYADAINATMELWVEDVGPA